MKHCEIITAVDELETLIIFPIVQLVGSGDMQSGKEGGLGRDAGEGEGCVPGVGGSEADREGEDSITMTVFDVSGSHSGARRRGGNVQAIISQSSLWRNLAPQLPASEHSHDFLLGIFTQHRFREPKHPRIVDGGFVSNRSVSAKVCLAIASQHNGISTILVGGDGVRGLVDDTVTICSGGLEPPTVHNVR